MVPKLNLVALAVTVLYAATASADEPGTSIFSLRSFGTLGIVHSSEDKADYSPSFFKPNGPGHSRSWSADVDSLIGVQLTGNFTPQLSAVLQVIAEQRYDNSYSLTSNGRMSNSSSLRILVRVLVAPFCRYF